MQDLVLEHEPTIRLAAFVGIFAIMAGWELLAPRRSLTQPRRRRWPINLGVIALNTVLLRFLFPVLAVGVALLAEREGFGLLQVLDVPFWLAVVAGVVLLDLLIYGQHVVLHLVPVLWRLHMVHHADLDFDVTTGARFHPVEIILSMVVKMAAVAVLGAPALAVVVFEVLLNGTTMFNHSNVRLPLALDRVVRWFIVTPDMHRVHHSVIRRETDSNFGFNLSLWDRLFGTYRAQPEAGHDGMTIGLEAFRDPAQLTLPRVLVLPFVESRGLRRP